MGIEGEDRELEGPPSRMGWFTEARGLQDRSGGC
ncbi:predicted protein [Plenodomus lingam JN3]|uniref:Predicted protein n=1 Tax=Leptosphaeria maculans (strain JN3 / isolate v23.1.3 / race Av1-4-5-6-7-8) TaxID=985895 RepID=E5AFR3_LEPMJ|nr:predicted protein [Plenodomus lingam JN3]CBY02052.1 predicted protein [Plenodomus lingam JN3]